MNTRTIVGLGGVLAVLAGCGTIPLGPLGPDASPPEDSGLIGEGPYPNDRSSCQVIGNNARTSSLQSGSALLIGCPAGNQRAINNRVQEGAKVLSLEGQWLLLSVPRRAPDPSPTILPETDSDSSGAPAAAAPAAPESSITPVSRPQETSAGTDAGDGN